MRIMMVSTTMQLGGVANVVKSLAEELHLRGHQVCVVSLVGKDSVITQEIGRRSLGATSMKGGEALRAVAALRDEIHEFKPDVIHAHAFHANCAALLAVAGTGKRSRPVITTIHSVREGGRVHRLLERLLYPKSAAIVGVSEAVLTAHGFSSEGHAIRNGVDDEVFRFNPAGRKVARTSLALADDATVLLSVGRLTAAKDHACLIDAMHRLSAASSGYRLLIAGDGPYRSRIERHIEELELQAFVTLLGERQDVPDLLSAADVYVQSSAWEGLPLVLLEAQAADLAIVATNVGGTAEISRPSWQLVKPGDADGLADAVMSAEVRTVSARDAGARTARTTTTSQDAMVASWLVCYDSVTS